MRKHLSFANVVASIALFAALGGTSYAASKVRGKDVVNGSLTGVDIKNRSIAKGDLKSSAIPKTRWLLLDESGNIEEQSGGFRVVSKTGINGQPATNPNVYIDANSSLERKGLAGTVAIQNKIDRNANGMPDPAFKGDVAVGRCNTGAINCVPAGTNADDVLVVRALADNAVATSQTRRVYVQVTP